MFGTMETLMTAARVYILHGSLRTQPLNTLQGTHTASRYLSRERVAPSQNDFFPMADSPSPLVPPPPMGNQELAKQHQPVFLCHFDGCNTFHLVTKDSLVQHLEAAHSYNYQRGVPASCLWTGCSCAGRAYRIGHCPDGPHPSHIEDLAEHIWNCHLHFRWVCPNCDCADWQDHPSLVSHMQNNCPGRIGVRCGKCYYKFLSEHDLAVHQCSAAV
jgi:hypothetical protein